MENLRKILSFFLAFLLVFTMFSIDLPVIAEAVYINRLISGNDEKNEDKNTVISDSAALDGVDSAPDDEQSENEEAKKEASDKNEEEIISEDTFNTEYSEKLLYLTAAVASEDSNSDGTLIYNIVDETAVVCGYSDSAHGDIEIPAVFNDYPVVAIAENAFKDNKTIVSVIIPDSVITIGGSAFRNCSALKSVSLPSSLTSIGNYAFYNCKLLKNISFEETKKICYTAYDGHYYAFFSSPDTRWMSAEKKCVEMGGHLVSITSEEENTFVASASQAAFGRVTSVAIGACDKNKEGEWIWTNGDEYSYSNWNRNEPNNLDGLQHYAHMYIYSNYGKWDDTFNYDCGSYYVCEWDTLPEKEGYEFVAVEEFTSEATNTNRKLSIKEYAFAACPQLSEVTLPSYAESLSSYVFANDYALTSVTFSEGVSYLGSRVFTNTNIRELTYPATLSYCATGVLYDTVIEKVIFADGTEIIAENACYGAPYLKSVVIPDSCTIIEAGAFRACSVLDNIALPKNLRNIGSNAFYDCAMLSSVNIPAGVEIIGEYAFAYDRMLKNVTFEENSSLNAIHRYAFYACWSLTEINMPQSLSLLGEYAFSYCSRLKNVNLNEGLKEIGSSAFYNCKMLTEISIPSTLVFANVNAFAASSIRNIIFKEGITEIPAGIFRGITNITSITIPEGVKTIGNNAFRDCTGLKEVIFPETLEAIGESAFNGCINLQKITIPAALTAINSYAFNSCYNLKEIDFSHAENLETISREAFYGCTRLEKAALPSSLKTLGYGAFSCCRNLNEVVLNEGLVTIEGYVFNGCNALKEVTIPASVTTMGSNIFNEYCGVKKVVFADGMTKLPDNALNNAQRVTEVIMPESITEIGSHAFYNCKSLSTVKWPEKLRKIGYYAFGFCTYITELTFSEYLEVIDSYAFYNCSNLQKVNFNSELTAINNYAFAGCDKLTEISIPKNVQNIGSSAFRSCYSLEKVIFAEGSKLKNLGDEVFRDCIKLSSVCIPASVTSSGTNCFYGCYSLKEASFEDDTVDVPSYIFYGAEYIEKVNFPSSVKTIGNYAFYGCIGLKDVIFNSRLRTIGDRAFYNCNSLEEISFENVEGIGQYAFAYCDKLKSIDFGSELDTIGSRAFYNCYALGEIYLPSTVKTISSYAFAGCPSLRDVYILSMYISIDNTAFNHDINITFFCDEDSDAREYAEDKKFDIADLPEKAAETKTLFKSLVNTFSDSCKYPEFTYDTSFTEGVLSEELQEEIISSSAEEDILTIDFDEEEAAENAEDESTIAFEEKELVLSSEALYDEASGVYYNGSVITSVGADVKTLVIPEEINGIVITSIAESAFYNNKVLESVTLPSSLITVERYAFKNCTGLSEVKFNDNLRNIGYQAFYGCTRLTSLEIPTNIVSCNTDVFAGCTKLTEVTFRNTGSDIIPANILYNCSSVESVIIPDDIYIISSAAFYKCSSLKEISLPEGLLIINSSAFDQCTYLQSITFPASLRHINDYAFSGCSKLREIIFPENSELYKITSNAFKNCVMLEEFKAPEKLCHIGTYAFYGCTGLESIELNDNLSEIYSHAFANCTYIRSITLPAYINTMENNVFSGCTRLTKIEFSEGTSYIPDNAFYGCESISEITIPESVRRIGVNAFRNCKSLEEVSFNSDLIYIDNSAFYGCSLLKSITLPENLYSLGAYAFSDCAKLSDVQFGENSSLYIINEYAFNNCDSLESITLPDALATLGSYAFANCEALEEVSLNRGLRTIHHRAFYNCTRLKDIVIPATVYSMESEVFANCTRLTEITIEDGAAAVPENAFNNAKYLESVIIPSSVEEIGNYAFYGCSALKEISFENIARIKDYAFNNCTSLESITLPQSLRSLGAYSFRGCTALKDVTIENGLLTTIGDYTFDGCSSLEKIEIPENISTIGSNAFSNCASLTDVILNEGLNTLSYRAFYNCGELVNIIIPSTIRSAGSQIFNNAAKLNKVVFADGLRVIPTDMLNSCNSVTEVVIPDSVHTIGYAAFANCSGLESIELADNIRTIGEYAFSGCSNLKSVKIDNEDPEIKSRAFQNCAALDKFILSAGFSNSIAYGLRINPDAFYNCKVPSEFILGGEKVSIDKENLTAEYKGHIYSLILSDEDMSYTDCEEMCLAQGAHLVTVTSRGEEAIIEMLHYLSKSNAEIFISGSDAETEGKWIHANGEDFTYSKWGSSQPDDYNDNEDYLCYGYDSYYWNDYPADRLLRGYIVEWDGDVGNDINLTVFDENGDDITSEVSINWYKQGLLVSQGTTLRNYDEEKAYSYEIVLDEELGMKYYAPVRQVVKITDENYNLSYTLTPVDSLTVSGNITSTEGDSIASAEVNFTQTVNGIYVNEVSVSTDENGFYTATLLNMPTSMLVAAPEYYNKTVSDIHIDFTSENVTLDTIKLKPMVSSRVSLSVVRISAVSDGEAPQSTVVDSTQGLEFTLYNVTKNCEIVDFVVQYPYILLESTAASEYDTVRVSVKDTTNSACAEDAEFTLDENLNSSVTIRLISNGNISFSGISDEIPAIALIFDENGKYISTTDLRSSDASMSLPEGNYKVVIIEKTQMLHRVSDISKLEEMGLTAGEDYILGSISVANGKVSELEAADVPEIDEAKLYYTVQDSTDFTSSRYELSQGKLLTLRAEYVIKEEFASKNEYVLISLPEGTSFIEGSVTVNGVLSDYIYSSENNTVKVFTNDKAAIVRCSVAPTKVGSTVMEAFLGFEGEEQSVLQPIGSVEITVSALKFTVPEKTGRKKIQLSGSALASSKIEIYDNDALVATASSNKNGSWNAQVELTGNADEYSEHSLYAVLTSTNLGYSVRSQTKKLIFDPDYVNLSKITMINTAHLGKTCEFVTVIDFLNPTNEKLSYNYWPLYPTFTFMVELTTDNPELVSDVYAVCTNAYGDVTYVPTVYDENSGVWVGKYDFYNSKEKPAAVSAIYTYNEPERASLLMPTLAEAADIEDGEISLTRTFTSDSADFGKNSMFGLGWQTGFETEAQYYRSADKTEEVITISGLTLNEMLKKGDDGIFRGTINKNATGFVTAQGITVEINSVTYVFDETRLSSVSNGEQTVEFTYENDKLTGIYAKSGEYIEFTYSDDKVISATDSEGETTQYEYDGNYLISATSDKGKEEYSYNVDSADKSVNALEEVIFSNGNTVNYEFDTFGRVISYTLGEDASHFEYVYEGTNKVQSIDAEGFTADFEFDDKGLVKTYSDDSGLSYTADYGDDFNLDSIVFEDGSKTLFRYDENNNLTNTEIISGEKSFTSPVVSFDEKNMPVSIKDANGNVTEYAWTDDGLFDSVTYMDGTTEKCSYDENGNLISAKQRNGNVIRYSYDENGIMNGLTADKYALETVRDEENNTISFKDNTGTTVMQTDDNGNCIKVTYPDGRTVSYTYNSKGLLDSMTDADGYKTCYIYNANGQLKKVTDANGKKIAEYSYNKDGSLNKRENGNGTYTTYTYNNGLVEAVTNFDKENNVVSFFKYELDEKGNIVKMTDKSGVWKYEYDERAQVTKIVQPDGAVISYTYDKNGNRLTETVDGEAIEYTSNSLDQYTKAGTKTYTYDLNGNLKTVTDGDKTAVYTYDVFNHLISIDDGENLYEYTYDVFGNRNSVTVNGETTEYVYSPIGLGNIVTAYTPDSGVSSYILGDTLTAAVINGEEYFYNFNSLGSTTEITSADGSIVNAYTYSADGKVTSRTEGINNIFTYGGMFGIVDDNNGLYYIRARYLSTETTSFITPDPSGTVNGPNRYTYCVNNFILYIDIDGEVGIVVACLIGAGVSVLFDVASDGVATVINGCTTGDWSWAGGNWKQSLSSYGISAVTGAFAPFGGAPAIIANIAGEGLKPVVKALLGDEKIDWGKVAYESIFGMTFSAISDFIPKVFDDLIPSASTWSKTYKSMITKLKNGADWKFLKVLKHTFKNAFLDFTNKGFGIFNWANDQFKDIIYDLGELLWGIVFGIDDPSGFVFEAVPSNRVQGVTATAYTIEEYYDDFGELQQDVVMWDATEFDQVNPLITDAVGRYAWDVPTGQWQVKYEKDGYETAYSEWLPVPPPQTEVNVGITSLSAPEIEAVNAYNDIIEIVFTQYMNIGSINADNISIISGGKAVSGTFSAVNAEATYNDPSISYASRFMFTPDNAADIGKTVTISVSDVYNYADTEIAKAFTKEYTVELRPTEIRGVESLSARPSSIFEITVSSDIGSAAAGKTVDVISSSPSIVSVSTAQVTFSLDGTAKILCSAKLPGSAEIIFTINGTTITGKTAVDVSMPVVSEHKHTPADKAVIENEIPADCEIDGSYVEVIYCTECGEAVSSTVVPVPAKGHSFTEYISDENATCTENGTKTATCDNCDKTDTVEEENTATGHSWNSGEVTKKPTCAEKGIKTFTCTACSAQRSEDVAKTTEHKWNSGKVTKAPTCAEKGIKTFTCTVCSAERSEDIAKTTAHKWNNGVVTKEATATEEGIITYTCNVCKTTKTESIPKLLYVMGDVDGDGNISASDARLALRASVGLESYDESSSEYKACDVDGDNKVTASDARLILRASVGLEDPEKW